MSEPEARETIPFSWEVPLIYFVHIAEIQIANGCVAQIPMTVPVSLN